MPRPKNTTSKEMLRAWIPTDLRGRISLELVSELEGRIPLGRLSEWVTQRLQEYFSWRRLDLTPYGFPQGFFVAGPREMLNAVEATLKARRPE